MTWWLKLRYKLIELIAGDMPVMLNMRLEYKDKMFYEPNPYKPGIFSNNEFVNTDGRAILTPKRES